MEYESMSLLKKREADTRELNRALRNSIFLSFAMGSVVIVWLKGAAFWYSGITAIRVSVFESFGDACCQGIFIWTWFSKNSAAKYPLGTKLLEACATLVFAVFMVTAMLLNIIDQFQGLINLLTYTTEEDELVDSLQERLGLTKKDAKSFVFVDDEDHSTWAITFGILSIAFVIKLGLFLFCREQAKINSSPLIKALAQDHIQDATMNIIVQLAFHFLHFAPSYFPEVEKRSFRYVDPSITVLVSIFLAKNWFSTATEQRNQLINKSAPSETIDEVNEIAKLHSVRLKNLVIVARGPEYVVEADLITNGDLQEVLTKKSKLEKAINSLPDIQKVCLNVTQ